MCLGRRRDESGGGFVGATGIRAVDWLPRRGGHGEGSSAGGILIAITGRRPGFAGFGMGGLRGLGALKGRPGTSGLTGGLREDSSAA